MQPGDIALSRNRSWYAPIICFVTRGQFSHVRLITSEDGECFEAVPSGARWGRVQEGDTIVPAPLTNEQRAQIRPITEQLIGTPYGWVDVVLLGLAQLGLRIPSLRKTLRWGRFRTRPIGEDRIRGVDHLFCSQAVDLTWMLVGFDVFPNRVPLNVSPADLEHWGLGHYADMWEAAHAVD